MQENRETLANAIFERVLKEIKPSKEELEDSVYNTNEITERLRRVIPKDVEVRVVGSVVRGTQLRGDSDIDIFLLFNKKHSREKITKAGVGYAKKIVRGKGERYEIKYAEHPYVRVYLDALEIKADIVPAFKIDNIEDMATSVDRSPMHAEFINSRLSEKQRDEVRLLKYLLNTHNVYGAEITTGGFSGYLCELLVYQYGSLLKLLEHASEFKLPVMLDPKSRAELSNTKLVERFHSRFIVIDPIDRNRNVAAGVSQESLARFAIVSREFVEKPRIELFYGKGFSAIGVGRLIKSFIRKSGLDMFVLEIKVPNKSEDIIWPQLRKVSEFIRSYAEKFGFRIYLTIPIVYENKGLIVFLAPKEFIGARLHKGPSAFIKKAEREFTKKHRNAIGLTVLGEAVYAIEKNKYPNLYGVMKVVAEGGIIKRHKDIVTRGSRLFANQVPKKYAEVVYSELTKRTSI